MRSLILAALAAACATTAVAQMQSAAPAKRDLRTVSSFTSIGDQGERSRALFGELAKV